MNTYDFDALTTANLLLDMAGKIMKWDEEEGDKLLDVAIDLTNKAIKVT